MAPCKRVSSSSSLNSIPLKLFLHLFSNSLSSNNLTPPSSCFNSGGNLLLSLNLSKCSLSILSTPEGKLGNIPLGREIFLTICSQKHLGQSSIKFMLDGES